MRRPVLLLASTALVVLLASGAALAFPVDEVEPNDSINQAQSIQSYFSLDSDPSIVSPTTVPHATVYGADDGTRDYYSFTANQAGVNTMGTFDIDGASPNFEAYLTLYDANGNYLREAWSSDTVDPGSANSSDPYLEYTFPRAGTYYIAVSRDYGPPGGYRLHVSVPGATTSDTPPPDATPPQTVLTQKPEVFSNTVSPRFGFASSDPNSTFECKLDGADYRSCTSPKQYFLLAEGEHTFAVRATDAAGNTDQTPAEHTWIVDSFAPKVTFTQRPGTATGPSQWDEWVTDDRSPTWAWNISDTNPDSPEDSCYLYDDTNKRYILDYFPCASSSPYTFEGELPDADYYFHVSTEDKAGNYDSYYNYFEVDTAAPKVVSGKPTGKRVSRYADVTVIFDDNIYGSRKFVNVYKKGSKTPMAISWREEYGKKIEISTKSAFKRGTSYTVKVTTGVNDGANNLEGPYSWSFKTKR